MTLEQSSKSEITAKSGSKISTKRTVKTFIPKSTVTSTPWGVSLKPVPRKKVVEEIRERKGRGRQTFDESAVQKSNFEQRKGTTSKRIEGC